MGTVLVQLSDIHLSMDKNTVLNRTDAIASVIRSVLSPDDNCILFITGDIANSGKIEEYVLAAELIEKLYTEISEHCNNKLVSVVVPGNHDLDFDTEGCDEEIRDLIIDKITPTTPPTETLIKYCTLPQANFSQFVESIGKKTPTYSVVGLIDSITLEVSDIPIRIHMINTARFSKKIDRPGFSWLPVDQIDKQIKSESGGAINISVMHHPFSWNREEIANDVKQVLETNCDVVLTGHIHEPDIYAQKRRNVEQNLFIEGGVLQDRKDDGSSSFNIVRLGDDNETFSCTVMHWTGDEYEPLTESYQHKYLRLRQPLKNSFAVQENWNIWLEKVGTDFRHTRKTQLKMSDLFVYPDLQRLDVRKACSPTGIIRDKDIIGFIQEKKRVLIAGVEKSGKTSLCKQLFKDLRDGGYVPLVIRSDFHIPPERQKGESDDRLREAFQVAVEAVYQPEASRRFWQTRIKERVLIIDDYGRIKLPAGARDELLRWADKNFGTIVVVCSPGLRLREILNRSEDDSMLWGFEHADILESDAEARYHIISKWVTAGHDPYQISDDEIHKLSVRRSQVIYAVIAQGVIPSLPMFILMMMQQLDGHGSVDANNGLYGSLYEVIIRDVIKEGTENPAEIEVLINYLTEFAFHVYSNKKRAISDENYLKWHTQYCETFNARINYTECITHLEVVGVFRRQNGVVCFKYKYYYWYFAAKYLASHIYNQSCFDIISSLTDHLYLEDAANIMLFLCHFSKDPRILEMILVRVKEHFPDAPLFDLSRSPAVIPASPTHLAKLSLSNGAAPKDELIKVLREQDDVARPNGIEEFDHNSAEVEEKEAKAEEKEAISLMNEVSSASHLIRICGQIIRNFYGGMKGDDQIAVIRGCYDLSLRMMSILFKHMEVDKDRIAETVAQILRQRNPTLTGLELDETVRRSLRTVSLQISYGFIKHVSDSIGLAELATSFDKVLDPPHNTVSYQLLDISTRLDFFDNFPEGQIMEVAEKIDRPEIGFEVLRILVWEHFKLFRHEFRIKQRVCNKLDIKINAPAFLGSKDKKILGN